jgi:hypothetical protein
MKSSLVLLSIAIAACAATTAEAASHAKHHARHMASATASKTDWAANPYMDLTATQRDAFFRDAFNPAGAK